MTELLSGKRHLVRQPRAPAVVLFGARGMSRAYRNEERSVMKWLVVAPEFSSLQTLVNETELAWGSRVPAKFIEFLLAQNDEVILVVSTNLECPAHANGRHPNLKIVPAPVRTSWRRILNGPFLYKTLAKIVKEERPDLMYAETYSAFPCSVMARCWGIPCFSRHYGTFLMQLFDAASLVSKWLPKLLAEVAVLKSFKDGLVLSDDGSRGDVVCRRLRVKSDNVLFPRNGVDKAYLNEIRLATDVSHTRRKYGLDETDFVITNVSRLAAWKRLDLVISAFDAMSRLPEHSARRPVLLICGTGQPKREKELREMAMRSQRRDQIRFLGNMEHRAAMELMRSSDVVTSFYEVSNVGNVLLEALQLGCVVVARDTGATSTLITHGVNGFLIPEQERQAIQAFDAITSRLLKKEGLSAEISKNALDWAAGNIVDWKERFQSEYDWILERVPTVSDT